MKNLTRVVMMGLLLVPFVVVFNLSSAYAVTHTVDQCRGAANANNDCFFVPSEIIIEPGDTVIWTNSDSATHTITSGVLDSPWGTVFDSGLKRPGTTFEWTFDTLGEYPYLCQLHPWMVGKVIVARVDTIEVFADIIILTDNKLVEVAVFLEPITAKAGTITIDPPQTTEFTLNFLDPTTKLIIQNVNYSFMVTDEDGNIVMQEKDLRSPTGFDAHPVEFSNTGSYTLTIDLAGTGINQPYETKYSGKATIPIVVTPEFSLSVMAIMATVVGITLAATKLKNSRKP